jgi:polysaccharide pyruvyl transferase CsaB
MGGYYGMRNVGDDVLLYVTIGEVSRLDCNAAFTIISSVPEVTPEGTRVTVRSRGHLRGLFRNDVWLFGGGGLLQDRSRRSLQTIERLGHLMWLAKLAGCKVVLLAIGVGPLVTAEGKNASRRVLQRADFVTVRDQQSAELALQLCPERALAVTDDLAFLLPRVLPVPPPRDGKTNSNKVLGVSLLAYSAMALGHKGDGDTSAAEILGEALNDILGFHRNWRVKLFEFFSGSPSYSDARVLRTLQDRIRFADRVSYCSYQGDFRCVYQELSRCDALLGMRFHSCLLAYLIGLPFLMIDYHPKCTSLATRLGLPERAVIPLAELTEAGCVKARLESLIEATEQFRSPVPSSSRTAESLGNVTLLADWLKTCGRDSAAVPGPRLGPDA